MRKTIREIGRNLKGFIEFLINPYDEENDLLLQELEQEKQRVRISNYMRLMSERLMPFVIDEEMSRTGLLLTKQEALNRAHEAFCNAKAEGKLDDLNFIKGK